MNSYQTVLANSRYTADWIEHRWGVTADVVYPPVDLVLPAARKENIIVSVGRFGGRSQIGKGQAAQLNAFREFTRMAQEHWTLYLVGSCYRPEDHTHVAALRAAARGLPVEFIVNGDRGRVLEVLAQAKIFWHTAGLLTDDGDPYHQEHFGIATVEAMRAACVPVVIASGGQKEIIRDGIDGFLCEDLQDFKRKTSLVAGNQPLRQKLADQAKRSSLAFSGSAFDHRILQIVSPLMDK